MITAPLLGINGQLGNQIFQFATLVGVATKNNYDFFIPLENLQPRGGECFDHKTNQKFAYSLSLVKCFDINCKILPLANFAYTNLYNEYQHPFNPELLNILDNTAIMGWFETEKYFEHCREKIKNLLVFKPEIEKISIERITKINSNNKKLLSLHIRRGQDRPVSQGAHPFLSKEYYEQCLSHFNSEYWKVIIFTDDFDWAKENINYPDIHLHEWCTDYERPDFIDLCMMTHCHSHIIANSTFSWWGAWLAKDTQEQQVFAPKVWFGPELSSKDTRDVIPERWNRIY